MIRPESIEERIKALNEKPVNLKAYFPCDCPFEAFYRSHTLHLDNTGKRPRVYVVWKIFNDPEEPGMQSMWGEPAHKHHDADFEDKLRRDLPAPYNIATIIWTKVPRHHKLHHHTD